MAHTNCILINCDDLGYGDLGCYGSTVNSSPAIDRLAAEGMRFTSFYAASPVCSPSRAALMTGCYPPRVGINRVLFPGEGLGLSSSEYTLPRMLRDAGYATMIIGKWHCGDQPEFLPDRFGFDDYYGIPYSNDMGMQTGRDDKDRFPPLPLLAGDAVLEQQPDQTCLTERYVEQGIRFIRKNRDHPFFLYLAHMHVHLPLYAPARFVRESKNGDFGACVASVDWSLACLMDEVKRLGLYEDTIFIFTSDNGSRGDHGASNAPLRGAKFTTWEGGMRVPFIIHWKGRIAPGQVNNAIAGNIDLLPTIAALTGQKMAAPHPIDGVDLSAACSHPDAAPRGEFAYFAQGADNTASLQAVRKGRWKAFFNRDGQAVRELYDLDADIGENRDVHADHTDVMDDLHAVYKRYEDMLGNAFSGVTGRENRPCATVSNPRTLTVYDENHPYIIAMYDKSDVG
ncbi:MAG: sulfatase [Oscillospiraceae bacterium]|jgi:arylsulfatase A-like enzyme|nr:sulfatase [Oscillospiraceae bacterium]